MVVLPTNPVEIVSQNPTKLIIFSSPKVGKTSLLAQLPNNLIIDFESGSSFVSALKIDVKAEARKNNKTVLEYIKDLEAALKVSNHKYDYITLDTITAIEDVAKDLALILYRSTPMGKNFMGNSVLELPQGGGYLFLRQAFEKIYNIFLPYATKCLILVGHIKRASINKDGKELQASDLDLSGKLKQIVCSDADAIGYLYRDKNTNTNILSFKTSENDLLTGARPPHLRGQDFVISELNGDSLTTHWDKIFLN